MNKLIAAIVPFIVCLTVYAQNEGEYDRGFKQFNWLNSVDSVLAKADLSISSIVYSGTQSLSVFKKDSSKILFEEKFQSNLFDVRDFFKRDHDRYPYEPDFFDNITLLNESTPILILELSNLDEKKIQQLKSRVIYEDPLMVKFFGIKKMSDEDRKRIEDSIKQVEDTKFTYELYFVNDQLFMVQVAFPMSSFDLNSIENKFNTSYKKTKDTVGIEIYSGFPDVLANRQIEWQNNNMKIIMAYLNEVDKKNKMIQGRPFGAHWRVCYIYKDFLENIKSLNVHYLDSLQNYCSQLEIYKYFSEPQNGIGNLNWGSNQISLLIKQFDKVKYVENSRFLNENDLLQANIVSEKNKDGKIISLKKDSHSIKIWPNSNEDFQEDVSEFGNLYYELDLLYGGVFNFDMKDKHLEYIFYKSLIRDYSKKLGKPSSETGIERGNDIENYCSGYLWESNDLKVELKYTDVITIEIHNIKTEKNVKEIRKVGEEKEKNKRLEQNKSIDNKY